MQATGDEAERPRDAEGSGAGAHQVTDDALGGVVGGAVNNVVLTGEGDRFGATEHDDLIFGLGGNDSLVGWHGNDNILGGDGHDKLVGYTGNDVLHGGAGWDQMHGGEGDDTIVADSGSDIASGDEGDDVLQWFPGAGDVRFHGGPGHDTIQMMRPYGSEAPLDFVLESEVPWREENGEIIFDGPASGTITWGNTTLTFTGVERIWPPTPG